MIVLCSTGISLGAAVLLGVVVVATTVAVRRYLFHKSAENAKRAGAGANSLDSAYANVIDVDPTRQTSDALNQEQTGKSYCYTFCDHHFFKLHMTFTSTLCNRKHNILCSLKK